MSLSTLDSNPAPVSRFVGPARGLVLELDVNRLAGRLGGGGHHLAAGARLRVGVDEAKRQVLAVLTDVTRA